MVHITYMTLLCIRVIWTYQARCWRWTSWSELNISTQQIFLRDYLRIKHSYINFSFPEIFYDVFNNQPTSCDRTKIKHFLKWHHKSRFLSVERKDRLWQPNEFWLWDWENQRINFSLMLFLLIPNELRIIHTKWTSHWM